MSLNRFRHYFLYSKGHYKTGNTYEDLQRIQCAYVGCDNGVYISQEDIVRVLTRAVDSLNKPMTVEAFGEIFLQYSRFNKGFNVWAERTGSYDVMIDTLLSILRHATVDEIEADGKGGLGDADSKILEVIGR
jgi:hypothetical protein